MALAFDFVNGFHDAANSIGTRITKLQPLGGFAAELAGALTIFMSSSGGVPVSTTHTITGAIVGVGSARRVRAVRWGVAGRIVWAWLLTIPAAAAISATSFLALSLLERLLGH